MSSTPPQGAICRPLSRIGGAARAAGSYTPSRRAISARIPRAVQSRPAIAYARFQPRRCGSARGTAELIQDDPSVWRKPGAEVPVIALELPSTTQGKLGRAETFYQLVRKSRKGVRLRAEGRRQSVNYGADGIGFRTATMGSRSSGCSRAGRRRQEPPHRRFASRYRAAGAADFNLPLSRDADTAAAGSSEN